MEIVYCVYVKLLEEAAHMYRGYKDDKVAPKVISVYEDNEKTFTNKTKAIKVFKEKAQQDTCSNINFNKISEMHILYESANKMNVKGFKVKANGIINNKKTNNNFTPGKFI